MAEGLPREPGGIFGLLDLVDEHREAIEFELALIGRDLDALGTPGLSWRALYVLVRRWQKLPGNAFAESVHGTPVPSWTEQVLAVIVDQLQAANFRLGRGKGSKPKRFERWWEKVKKRFGRDPIPMSKFDDWWESAGR